MGSSGLFLYELRQLLRMLLAGPSSEIRGCVWPLAFLKSPFVILMYNQDAEAGSLSSCSSCLDRIALPRSWGTHAHYSQLPVIWAPRSKWRSQLTGAHLMLMDSSHSNVFWP